MSMPPDLLKTVTGYIAAWGDEDAHPWMYLDKYSDAWIGSFAGGIRLSSEDSAAALQFYHEKTRQVATPEAVKAAWKYLWDDEVKFRRRDIDGSRLTNGENKSPSDYEAKSDLRVSIQTLEKLRKQNIEAHYVSLKKAFIYFDNFAEDAQVALFDMIYTLNAVQRQSATKGDTDSSFPISFQRYGMLRDAIEELNWVQASRYCRRFEYVTAERNAETMRMFRDAAIHQKLNAGQQHTVDWANTHGHFSQSFGPHNR